MSILKTKKSLASLKAAFGDSTEPTQTNFVNNYYPFWNMPTGARAVIRFLPDLNDDNPRGFLQEKIVHKLTINGQVKTIPCLTMYGEKCPICELSQSFYKLKDEVQGKKYWKSRQYLAQAIIVEDPLDADSNGEKHEGKVRMIALSYQIYNIITAAFKDDELEEVPYDITEGHDFIIKKTDGGKYPSYVIGTKFMNKSRALTPAEIAAAEEGMVDLATLLPKHPGLEVVEGMLNAERNGTAYEEVSTKPAYQPKPAPAVKAKPAPVEEEDEYEAPIETKAVAKKVVEKLEEPEASTESNVDDMLAQIRARRKAAQAK